MDERAPSGHIGTIFQQLMNDQASERTSVVGEDANLLEIVRLQRMLSTVERERDEYADTSKAMAEACATAAGDCKGLVQSAAVAQAKLDALEVRHSKLMAKAKLKFADMQAEISVSDARREKLELELWAVESSRSDAVASAARSTAAPVESGAIVLRIQAGLDSTNAECLAATVESSRLCVTGHT